MQVNSYTTFKYEKDKTLIYKVHPILFDIANEMSNWCKDHSVPFKITATVTTKKEDDLLGRMSDSHRTNRAFDCSIRNWDKDNLVLFQNTFNIKYRSVASISRSDSIARLVVLHGLNQNRHFHIALHSKYSQKVDTLLH